MKKSYKIVFPLLALVCLIGGVWLAASAVTEATQIEIADMEIHQGEGPLDDMTFVGALGPENQPKDVADTFVFSKGTFVSRECEVRCNYPPRPYYVRKVGDVTEFVSETKCPDKDAWIVWRGRYKDGKISGVATWTMKRWYWTVEQKYAFAGELENQSTPVASNQ